MSEQKLEGFLGIKFGASTESVKDFMLAKPNCNLDLENSDNNQLFFEGAKFAGRDPLFILFKFVDNKFHTACVLIKPKLESQTIDLYNEIKDEINEKYYKTSEDYETYKYPYEKNDGHTETAIELGKASFSSYWKFNASSKDNYIALSITEGLHIKISYQDGMLVQIAVERENAKNNDDY
jgi:hypothetical protein